MTRSPSVMPSSSASAGWIITFGIGWRFWLPGVSAKLELRKLRDGLVARRNGVSSFTLSVTSQWSAKRGISEGSQTQL